jgi:hypothetical protein
MVWESVSHESGQHKGHRLILWQVFFPSSGRYTGAKRTSLHFDQWIHNLDREAFRMYGPGRVDIWM